MITGCAGMAAASSLRRRVCCRLSPRSPAAHGVRVGVTVLRGGLGFFFTSQGKTGLVNADGSGLRYFQFDKPGQATWQPAAIFPDGRRVLFLSMEPRRDGPGRPFSEYYTQTPTHIWIHDLETGSLEEICTKDRLAPFETPALLLSKPTGSSCKSSAKTSARSSAFASTGPTHASSRGPARDSPMA